jgi:hypothetical protein
MKSQILQQCTMGFGTSARKISESPNAAQLLAFENVGFERYMAAGGKDIPLVPEATVRE